MKIKKIFSAAAAFMLIFAVGCDNISKNVSENTFSDDNPVNAGSVSSDKSLSSSSSQASLNSKNESKTESVNKSDSNENDSAVNPLTGLRNLDKRFQNTLPVAVMINNITAAQDVQSGINLADIVYETEVEGGITRLMGVYQNITTVSLAGSIRSARYAFIDLSMGHNAVYCHHGQDPTYAKPHLKDTFSFVIDVNNAGKRINNGKSYAHTLYLDGPKLWNYLSKKGKIQNNSAQPWQNFSLQEISFPDGKKADEVYIPFSGASKSSFVYDRKSKLYTRKSNGIILNDYSNKKPAKIKNIFILMTGISNYSDNYHRFINLSSGNGFYVTDGKYIPVKWSKGKAAAPLKFTGADGKPIKVNAGKSWVCIVNKNTCKPTFS